MPHVAPRDVAEAVNKPMNRAARSARPSPTTCRHAARIDATPSQAPRGARVGISRPHESAHLHVAGEATYIDDLPELAGTLHCALGLSPVAHGRLDGASTSTRIRAHARRGRGADGRRHPRAATTAARSSTTTRSCADGDVHYLGQPVFAVIAETRDAARRAAAQAQGRRSTHRAAAAGADAARGARARAVRAAADAPGARRRRRAGRHRRGAAPAQGHARRRRPGAVLSRRPDQLRDPDARTAACWCTARRSIRARCSTWSRMRCGLHVARTCRSSAGAWAAASAARSRSRRCSPASPRSRRSKLEPAGQAAARPRRRLHDHRPAPLLRVRVRGRLRRRRPHPRRRDRRWSRAPATRPTCRAR